MTIESKLLGVSPSGAAANVADVFSTYVYTGNSTTQTNANGIDLAGEGGLVWLKWRSGSNAFGHALYDSERGVTKELKSQTSGAESTENRISSFNSSGFTLTGNTETNYSGDKYVSWTFRKAPKFFDVVTWTGDGSAGPFTLSHNLGSSVGMSVVKLRSDAGNWITNHRSIPTQYLTLDTTDPAQTDVTMTSTDSTITFNGSNVYYNFSGRTYVAYLFADNSAEDAEEQMIKCGSFTTNSSGGATVNLGWQPQFLIFKIASGTADGWYMFDTMRDFAASTSSALFANTSAAEASSNGNTKVTSNGFDISNQQNSVTYIYMAVRAPMMVEPEAATDVFAVDNVTTSTPKAISNFPIDFSLTTSGTHYTVSRLMGTNVMATNSTGAQFDWGGGNPSLDYMDGFSMSADMNGYLTHMWKRAKGFFDVVAYTGDGVSGRTVAHSLGVAPEMIWVKNRNAATSWYVYNVVIGNTKALLLNEVNATLTDSTWNNTTPTESLFTTGQGTEVNDTNKSYIAYLFATLAGISKVGSYTGNGSYQTINCGFAAGSRFILIKRTDATGDWYVWDSARGITAGNDPHLSLNTSGAEVTTDDSVDPENSGFIVNQNSATNINVTSATYIFYAIA